MKEALFYETLNGNRVRCNLCPKNCIISYGKTGFCMARINQGGKLYSLTYDKPVSVSLDPIEKKPLYHFYPGSKILSIGTFGCNFDCDFCQNSEISRDFAPSLWNTLKVVTPERIIDLAKESGFIAFTYNEPVVFYEYMLDIAEIAKQNGIKTVMVSNGFINEEPLEKLIPFIDAANIDLKGDDPFYRSVCAGQMDPVKRTIKMLHDNHVWVEVTLLLIERFHTDEVLNEIFSFIASVDKNIPLHISRYFPMRRMHDRATSVVAMKHALKIAKKYLNFVYLGNVDADQNTYCPKCHELMIERSMFSSSIKKLVSKCGYKIPGRFYD